MITSTRDNRSVLCQNITLKRITTEIFCLLCQPDNPTISYKRILA